MKRLLILIMSVLSTMQLYSENKALLIGIGDYLGEYGWNTIHGNADIYLLKPRLEQRGFEVKTLIDSAATKSNIQKALKALIDETKDGDKIYIHFSGHGQRITDLNGDEESGMDETIVPYDAKRSPTKGVYDGEKHFIDDELSHLLSVLKQKVGTNGEILLAIDACYSNGTERAFNNNDVDSSLAKRGTDDKFEIVSPTRSKVKDIPLPQEFDGGGLLTVISACESTECNYEYRAASGQMYGSLSYCIAKLLEFNANFNKWTRFFQNEEYRRWRVFQSCQHPTITVYN